MKFYEFGEDKQTTLMLLPGTKCHWKNNFSQVILLLEKDYHVIAVSYDGFDETENTIYPDMMTEVEMIEDFITNRFEGNIDIVYGCSLGGSIVASLVARQNIHISHGILGSSDLDQSGELSAKINQKLTNPIVYKYLHNGNFPNWMKKLMEKAWGEEYTKAMLKMMGIGGVDMSFVAEESCYNQDYYDLVTSIPKKIEVPGTQIHIFYALKMGKKYEKRYLTHFKNPDIIRQNYEHEELLMCYPDQWVEEIKKCTTGVFSDED